MNYHENQLLKENWEALRERYAYSLDSHDLSLSDNSYAVFGTCGISVYKRKGRKWYRITVNNWKNLSFQEFSVQFRNQKWETI